MGSVDVFVVPLPTRVSSGAEAHGTSWMGFWRVTRGLPNRSAAANWVTSLAVSSRKQDFMDEEDDAMFGKKLVAKQEFDTFGSSIRESAKERADDALSFLLQREARAAPVIPGPIMDELIVPSSVPIGKRLLARMGWRDGQGVGPRAHRQPRRRDATAAAIAGTVVAAPPTPAGAAAGAASVKPAASVAPPAVPRGSGGGSGRDDPPVVVARPGAAAGAAAGASGGVTTAPRAVPNRSSTAAAAAADDDDDGDGEDADPFAAAHAFAPSNAAVFTVAPKNDRHGLGFDPLANAPEFQRRRSALTGGQGGDGRGRAGGGPGGCCVCVV